MADLDRSLSELEALGMHLDPSAARSADEGRRHHLNTHLFPFMRLVGFQLLLIGVVVHNVAVLGEVRWGPVLTWAVLAETYCALSWLALRRWFGPQLFLEWDLSDLLFATDLVLWVGAIYVTGANESLLFFLPLLRVADHQVSERALALALLGPALYAVMVLWVVFVDSQAVSWAVEGAKVFFLLAAGLYIEFSGRPAKRLQRERQAALESASQLLAQLRRRTTRLDGTNQQRSRIRARLDGEVRSSLVDIIGFSVSLLRSRKHAGGAERRYLQRIHDRGIEALRTVNSLVSSGDDSPAPSSPLSRILVNTAAREAALMDPEDEQAWEPAEVHAPRSDVMVAMDEAPLGDILLQVMSAARHLSGAPPRVTVRLDRATHLADAVEVRAVSPPVLPSRLSSLFQPFSTDAAGDFDEMGVRVALGEAKSLLSLMGCELVAERDGDDLVLLLMLR